ncbi:hypothetical protein WA026_021974 [Henosepilachna vigintioctopunctata]|uniref:Uncharacterized protein n=1 Tax=Henosepilachna vigintioctopunctata TaxID=420089 RepID=A0AAW1VG62_9CUCU
MKFLLTLCNLLICVMASGPTTDYCFLDCPHSVYDIHVVCSRLHSCPKPKKCVMHEANKQWREIMLNIVNDARNGAANGSKRFTFENTGAKKMYALSYDMELEYIITCEINDCDKPSPDGCYQTIRFTPFRFGILWKPQQKFDMDLWRSVIILPEDEEMRYNARTDEGVKQKYKNRNLYHLFNVLYSWNAKYVGCGAVNLPGETYLVCLIGPVINNIDDVIYKVAKHRNEIASECEEGRNRKYPALCGNIDEVPAEEMWSNRNITFNSSRNIFCVDELCKSIMIFMFICSLFEI